jgi:hypothetical protein
MGAATARRLTPRRVDDLEATARASSAERSQWRAHPRRFAMIDTADYAERTTIRAAAPTGLFALTAFVSAGLVFTVEPMIARLVLPLLGGSAAVWNTSLAFFQAALLVGYVYAHLLQRLRRVSVQIVTHLAVLVAAGLVLPLHVTALLGVPSSSQPALWLVGVLAVSIGAPFAALSATAPLVQAWYARAVRHEGAGEPYVLYAASNLGSLLALIAYPVAVEPNLLLHVQTGLWSVGYGAFVVLAAILGVAVWRGAGNTGAATPAPTTTTVAAGHWRERLTWLALAAAPSSLMLGVTTYITTDLGSAPFLWVAPLALYLTTFIIAFQARPLIRPPLALALQAGSLAACAVFFWAIAFLPGLAIHLTCFFLTALVCHQALVARRPPPERLTDFYIWMSLGGVVGGAFNAFIAPLIFNTVAEYPAVLVLTCLVHPWGRGKVSGRKWAAAAGVLGCGLLATQIASAGGLLVGLGDSLASIVPPVTLALALLAAAAVLTFLLRDRAILFLCGIVIVLAASWRVSERRDELMNWRDFFGVLTLSHSQTAELGDVKMLWHGTTLHGAQSPLPAYRCQPLAYYAPETPIGQVFEAVRGRPAPSNIGVVGLGTGAVAAYTRPGDRLRFFEIDPAVVSVATNPNYFSYTTRCAGGAIAYTLGDARLTVAAQPAAGYDLLLIDAFSSDSVPTHLLTREAMGIYLSKLKPNGVLVLHLSNSHLELMHPAQATAIAAGGQVLQQKFHTTRPAWAASEDAVIVGKSPAALAPFVADGRWSLADPGGVKPWTDDYADLFGALVRRTSGQ